MPDLPDLDLPIVNGYCPMGCGRTLALTSLGNVVCWEPGCRRADAVTVILGDKETEHVVGLGTETFNIKHPLRERLDDALLGCGFGDFLKALDGPPAPPGRYRAVSIGGVWRLEALDV